MLLSMAISTKQFSVFSVTTTQRKEETINELSSAAIAPPYKCLCVIKLHSVPNIGRSEKSL